MEKVVALLWAPTGIDPDTWRDRLLADVVPALRDAAGGATRITVLVTDHAVDRGVALHLGSERPDGVLTWWTERSDRSAGHLATLAGAARRVEAYLVCESRPLVADEPTEPGVRTTGFVNVAGITPKPGSAPDEFRHHWFDLHGRVAIDTQSTTAYVRNEVVRPLTPGAPPWAGIVEETFPLDALDDPAVFFDAVGDPDRLARHQQEMFESVDAFLDLSVIEARPMSEYRCWP